MADARGGNADQDLATAGWLEFNFSHFQGAAFRVGGVCVSERVSTAALIFTPSSLQQLWCVDSELVAMSVFTGHKTNVPILQIVGQIYFCQVFLHRKAAMAGEAASGSMSVDRMSG